MKVRKKLTIMIIEDELCTKEEYQEFVSNIKEMNEELVNDIANHMMVDKECIKTVIDLEVIEG